MILDILQILAGVAGFIGIVLAVSIGYRSSQSAVPSVTLKLGAFDASTGAHVASVMVNNPGRQPIVLRALAIQRPRGAAFLAAVEEVKADGSRKIGPQPTDVVSLDTEIEGQASRDFDLYITFGEGGKARRVQIEVEYIDKRAPTHVLSMRIESQGEAAPA